jgi:2-keto-3-deoxy-L-fuconate dehydrogenase
MEMADRLKGKVVLVTAAAAGIGRAIAQTCAAEGARVIATDLAEDKLKGVNADKLMKLDVRSTTAVNALAKEVTAQYGPLNVLINCAGFVHHGTALDTSDEDWDFSMDLNVKSMHRTIHAFLPGMLENGGGSIVNIASGAGSVRGVPNRYVYGASKAAVIGLTKSVAIDFIRKGIRCNAICPGTIESPSLDQRIETLAKNTGQPLDVVRKAFVDRQPIGRLGTPQEIAWLALYLASDEASYTTGQIHLADGGFAL